MKEAGKAETIRRKAVADEAAAAKLLAADTPAGVVGTSAGVVES